jgi:hypothetical protein
MNTQSESIAKAIAVIKKEDSRLQAAISHEIAKLLRTKCTILAAPRGKTLNLYKCDKTGLTFLASIPKVKPWDNASERTLARYSVAMATYGSPIGWEERAAKVLSISDLA